MQILVKVDTGYLCDWRAIEPLQPEGFKGQTQNEKETLKNSIIKNGFHDAFDVWQHDNKLLSIDGVHRKIALLELSEEGYEIPEQLPCTYVTAENETEAATIILSRNSQHSHILSAAVMTAAFKIPDIITSNVIPKLTASLWGLDKEDMSEMPLDSDFSDFLNNHKESDTSDTTNKLVLSYNEADYDFVLSKFNDIGGSKESIVFNLLINEK